MLTTLEATGGRGEGQRQGQREGNVGRVVKGSREAVRVGGIILYS